MEEARALGLLHRTAPAARREAAAIALARELAAHPPEGLRRLKAMFRELTGSAGRVARENELLVDFQRTGAGPAAGRAEGVDVPGVPAKTQLERVRELCLSLPETTERLSHGQPELLRPRQEDVRHLPRPPP